MKRLVEVKVDGSHLTKNHNLAGVQHEANMTSLRITFDESWAGLAKTVTWWDAKGRNPVRRVLTTDLLEDITKSTQVYLCTIPGEPLAEAGMCTFVIDGYVDGKRQRSISDQMKVTPAPYAENAGEAADPTPTQAEQIQVQLDAVLAKIQKAIEVSYAADEAKATAEYALAAADRAEELLKTGTHAVRHQTGGDDPLTPAMIGAVAESDTKRPKYMGMDFTSDLNAFHGYRSGTFTTATTTNVPDKNVPFYDVWNTSGSGRFFTQYASVVNENRTYMRKHYDGAWTAWTRVLDAGISPELIYAAQANSIYDIDVMVPTGLYRVAGAGGTFPPGGENGIGTLVNILWDANYADQLFMCYHTFRMYRRRRNGAAWEPWYIVNDGYTFTKGTTDIGVGAAMQPGTWYAVYE